MLSAPARPTCRHSLGKDGESAEGTGVGRVCPWFLTALLPAGIESPASRPGELGERQQKAIDSADPSIWGLLLTEGSEVAPGPYCARNQRSLMGLSKQEAKQSWVGFGLTAVQGPCCVPGIAPG